jgi:succinoglycan biosynthesis protein ExoM
VQTKRRNHIAILVATYRRPVRLEALLAALGEVEHPAGSEVRAFVVDNDGGGSAEAVVRRASERWSMPIQYLLEPRRGIPFARNAGLDAAARAGADVLR